ncbi:hypothetical protein [Rickettsiella endosymbiont of Aleochara curtula]|uniref:hypothetical protein n=1 Tax=Rickettsiella endosymbiont of Aleochara curtula TaxID=3077936 RepID=UPI00313D16BC
MPNNKTSSETSTIEGKCRVCLIRTLTDPDLHDRLKKQENNWPRYLSQSFSSIFSVNTSASLDKVFLDSEQEHTQQEREEQVSMPPTPYPTPNSSNTSIPRFYISSSSSSEIVDIDNGETSTRRYTF